MDSKIDRDAGSVIHPKDEENKYTDVEQLHLILRRASETNNKQ